MRARYLGDAPAKTFPPFPMETRLGGPKHNKLGYAANYSSEALDFSFNSDLEHNCTAATRTWPALGHVTINHMIVFIN